MAEEEGSLGGVSDIVNPSALFCFDIRGFENYLSSQHFNSDSIKEGGTSQMEGRRVSLSILPEITSIRNQKYCGLVPGTVAEVFAQQA